ncbi:MAG: FlgO family outer membrane protein [Candidatus Theseobacter exili]|nr:FlgO family outer membrane protein [Candidatus Theseobacter exili]
MVYTFLFLISYPAFSEKQTSSGFVLKQNQTKLPSGVPARVGVAIFSGKEPLNQHATDQFSAGLLELGFDVIERNHFQSILDEQNISNTALFSDKTRSELGKQLGLEAIFVGSVTDEKKLLKVTTHVNVKLVNINTGRVLWAATAKDPRILGKRLTDLGTSISHTVNEALKMLENDLEKLRNT